VVVKFMAEMVQVGWTDSYQAPATGPLFALCRFSHSLATAKLSAKWCSCAARLPIQSRQTGAQVKSEKWRKEPHRGNQFNCQLPQS